MGGATRSSRRLKLHKGLALLAALLVLAGGLVGFMYWQAARSPEVRRATLPLLPAGAEQVTIAHLSDIHVAGPDMSPQRLTRIVDQVNALRPDLVLMSGDFVSDKRAATRIYSAAQAVQPLARLRAPLGVFAVPGNHDYWRGITAFERAFAAADIRLLRNEAALAGPVVLAGVDDAHTGRSDVAQTFRGLLANGGPVVVLTHSPDAIPELPAAADLVFAGHTHCGQIAPPFIGPLATFTRTGERYACGHVVEGERHSFISAGLGTSLLPLRLGAVPDIWLVTLAPVSGS